MSERAEIITVLGADGRPLEMAIGQAENRAERFVSKLDGFKNAIAGAFVTGAVLNMGRAVTALADQVSEASAAAGMTTDQWQAMGAAARDAGVDDDKLLASLSRLRDMQGKLIQGDKAAAAAFQNMGLKLDEVAKADTATLLEMIAKKIKDSGDNAVILSQAMDLLGAKAAPKLMEALRRLGSEGFQKMISDAKEAGQVLDSAVIQSLKDAEDEIARWKRSVVTHFGEALGAINIFFRALKKSHEQGGFFQSGKTMKDFYQEAADEYFNYETAQPAPRVPPRPSGMRVLQSQGSPQISLASEETPMERIVKNAFKAADNGFSRTAIGGQFSGAGASPMLSIQQRHLTTAERMARSLDNILKTLQRPPDLPPASWGP